MSVTEYHKLSKYLTLALIPLAQVTSVDSIVQQYVLVHRTVFVKRDNTFKKKVYLFFSILVFIIGSIGLINYIMDPFQIFRKHDHGFDSNQRYQNVGLINSYLNSSDGYNSIIIGTSVTENFIPSEVENLLGWGKVLKLSASGASLFTQKQKDIKD